MFLPTVRTHDGAAEVAGLERSSVDFYATMRTLYLERRARLIEDTSVRTAELPDF